MEEKTFIVKINCSQILSPDEEALYTMFIDTEKVTLVYEFVEWIRWIFSVDVCFYLIDEDSVIHELEDIRILRGMKNLKIKPCDRMECVHKKLRRTLPRDLKMLATYKSTIVHRCLVNKVMEIERKIPLESCTTNFESNTWLSGFSSKNGKDDLQNETNLDKKDSVIQIVKQDESLKDEENKNTKPPIKNQPDVTKTVNQKNSSRHPRPFSLGEILSDIRKDFEVKTMKTELKPLQKFSVTEEEIFYDTVVENPIGIQENKRKKTRKRKKAKKQNDNKSSFKLPFQEHNDIIGLNVSMSEGFVKPNHIRFNLDEEIEQKSQSNNGMKSVYGEISNLNSPISFQNEDEKLEENDNSLSLSHSTLQAVENAAGDKMECSPSIVDQERGRKFSETEYSKLDQEDYNLLLSLKEKFKGATVINRFF